ncbi:MAG: hypothetical protein GWP19_11885 [Planctomycetia bacterium]|nr:hypothetical protein [Planctomycetia bacterium]
MEIKYLTLIRHAKSSWKFPELTDFDRPLNKRGLKSASLMGVVLQEQAVLFDAVFSSSAKRAHDTIELICERIGFPLNNIKFEDELYDFHSQRVYEYIKHFDDSLHDVALAGHNPVFHRLATLLTGESIVKFPTCAIARMRFDVDQWRQVTGGTGRLVFYDCPKYHTDKY